MQPFSATDAWRAELEDARNIALQDIKCSENEIRRSEEAIARARKNVADKREAIASFNRKLNANAYISRAPDQILEEVFFCCLCKHSRRSKSIPYRCLDCNRRDPYHVLGVVGSVCHRWLLIVQHSPRLWTTISVDGGVWSMKRALLKSRPCPLHVHFDPSYLASDRFRGSRCRLAAESMRRIFKRLYRTEELMITSWASFMEDNLYTYMAYPAPELRKLVVMNCQRFADHHRPASQELKHILCHPCPQLASISLKGFSLASICPQLLPALRELCFETTVSSSSVGKMALLLESLPQLAALSLLQFHANDQHLDESRAFYLSPTRSLALFRLRSLTLKGFPAILLRMLGPLVGIAIDLGLAPARSYLSNRLCFEEMNNVAWDMLELFFEHHRAPNGEAKTVRLCDPTYRNLLRGQTFFLKIEITCHSGLHESYQPFSFQTEVDQWSLSLAKLCKAVGSLDIRELQMSGEDDVWSSEDLDAVLLNVQDWSELMRLLPLLEVIGLEGARGTSLFDALRSTKSTWPLPFLRKLALRPLWNTECEGDVVELASGYVGSLVYALVAGENHGWVLEGLEIDAGGTLAEDAFAPLTVLVKRMLLKDLKQPAASGPSSDAREQATSDEEVRAPIPPDDPTIWATSDVPEAKDYALKQSLGPQYDNVPSSVPDDQQMKTMAYATDEDAKTSGSEGDSEIQSSSSSSRSHHSSRAPDESEFELGPSSEDESGDDA